MNQPQTNGHAPEPAINQSEAAASARAQIDAIVEPIIGNMVNGLLITLQGVPPAAIATAVARLTGRVIGRVIRQGPLTGVLMARASMKQEFNTAMEAVKPIPSPEMAQAHPGAQQG